MNTFYIVRHGETENNRAGRLSGWIDTPLTGKSIQATDAAIAKLRPIAVDEIYSSDLGRAFVTAYIVSHKLGIQKQIIRLPGLREVSYGDAGNLSAKEAYSLYPMIDRDTHYVPPHGESLAQMQQRVLDAVNEINDAHDGKNIILVTHSGVMAALHSDLLGKDLGKHNIAQEYPHDYVARFTITDGKITSFEEVGPS